MLYMYNITKYEYFFIVTVDQLNGSSLNKIIHFFIIIKTWYKSFHNLFYYCFDMFQIFIHFYKYWNICL